MKISIFIGKNLLLCKVPYGSVGWERDIYIYIQIHDFLLFSHRSQKQKFGDAQMNKERPSNKAPLE